MASNEVVADKHAWKVMTENVIFYTLYISKNVQ